MDTAGQRKLEELRSDYTRVVGQPFQHFFCPLLLKDERVKLCKGHLVNQAFGKSNDKWTVQRADVDNFYGRIFEGDFSDLRHRGTSINSFIVEPSSMKSMRPEIRRRGEKIDYYLPEGPIPASHSQLVIARQSSEVRLALKLHPNITLETPDEDWQIVIEKDCRLSGLVSVLKAAHLCLFEMLGYRYALSAGGLFLGRDVLGKFFLDNREFAKKDVLKNATKHFIEYSNLVRPVVFPEKIQQDTINDNILFLCEDLVRWAFLVFIRTGDLVHAALVPLLESPDAAARLANFMATKGATIHAKRCVFDGESFQISPESETMIWPEASIQ